MTTTTVSSSEADAAAGVKKKSSKEPKTSKRQARKIVNPSNTWPQQPKLSSPAARAKAYLRVAGLSDTTTKSTRTLDPSVDLHSPQVQFGRMLGSTNQRKRHAAVTKLQFYLKQRCDITNENGGISELDLMKLWKGLWYTLFMADKVPVQDELSKRLAELIWCVAGTEEEDEYAAQAYMSMCGGDEDYNFFGQEHDDEELMEDEESDDDDDKDAVIMEEVINTLENSTDDEDEQHDGENENENVEDSQDEEAEEDDWNVRHCRGAHLASLFVKTFFLTIRREWGNMDKHRVDKFYTLIRLMMQQIFRYMALRHWNIGIIRLFNDTLFEQVLSQVPNGIRYHVIDLCMEELVSANAAAPMPLTEATFLDCLEPYFAMVQFVSDKLVHNRVMDKILTNFLENHSVVSDKYQPNNDENDEHNKHILDQVHVGSVAQFIFELASNEETQDRYRKDLYDMHKTYMKRLKLVGRDVVLDINSVDDGSDAGYLEQADTYTEENQDEIEEEEISKKSKKKDKKKERHDDEAALTNETHQEEVDQACQTQHSTDEKDPPTKKKKKKKRSLDKIHEHEDRNNTDHTTQDHDLDEREHKKKKRRKKKDKKDKIKMVEQEEEEVIISTAEQKKAAKAPATSVSSKVEDSYASNKSVKKKSSKKKERKRNKQDAKERRVTFGTYNHSKSYKASMRALTTMEQPDTTTRSPDKSILLKKGGVIKKTRPRNSAVDYF